MSAGSSPATGDVSRSDSISPVQGARVILKTETRRSMWRTTLATAGFLFLTKERQRVDKSGFPEKCDQVCQLTECASFLHKKQHHNSEMGAGVVPELGDRGLHFLFAPPRGLCVGTGGGGLPLQVAPCCPHPCGGPSAPCPAGGETSAWGAGLGAELSWRLTAARPRGRQEVGQDPGRRHGGCSQGSPLTLPCRVQSRVWGP